MRIRAGFEPRRGCTTPRGSLGPENAPSCTARRTPMAQIRRGLTSKVVGVVRAEILALPPILGLLQLLELLELLSFSVLCAFLRLLV